MALLVIGDNVRQIGQYQFTGAGYSSWSAYTWMIGKLSCGITDLVGDAGCGRGIVHCDETSDLLQIMDGAVLPPYVHFGAGLSVSVPQLDSH